MSELSGLLVGSEEEDTEGEELRVSAMLGSRSLFWSTTSLPESSCGPEVSTRSHFRFL